ncbi:oligogalacturonate-specific porin KdgM family protein [Psychromonas aquimarina]|uniref:oligogalacturonate-specific porin KdgM family protein n=1 Tax=Psychromonas aquimarina TaxID=444919 RepID=UPI0003FA4377|nr:oligogalacturonate-specific porin KdgM family protein [Psychromonas aquimarina]
MNTISKVVISSALLAAAGYAAANDYKTTIEYRHEYRDGVNKHSDRVKAFIDTGKNIGFELDARYNNDGEDEMFNSMTMNGSELSIFYYDKLNDNTVGLVGASLDYNPDGLVYVPYVRLNYAFDNGFRVQGRYKWKLWDYSQTGTDGQSYHSKIQQGDAWLGYKTGNWDFQYEFNYWKEMEDNAKAQFDNGSTNYLNNVRFMYSINTTDGTTWRPFIEIGDVSVNNYTDERQLRYRVGIKYTW